MGNNFIDTFLVKYIKGTYTDLEYKEFKDRLETMSEQEILDILNRYPLIAEGIGIQEQVMQSVDLEQKIEEALDKIDANREGNKIKRFKLWRKWSAAAAIIILTGIGVWFYAKPGYKIDSREEIVHQKILPGSDKAILTLANGTKIDLDDAKNGNLGMEGGVLISKNEDGQLVYEAVADNNDLPENSDMRYSGINKIETPNGGQYQIKLPDGTKIWLNAASSFSYPVKFSGTERKVELTGEAYFEVASDKKRPFKVVAHNQTIEVLGTHFNVNAYPEERVSKTTLLEGKVKITENKSGQSKLLAPGQQANVTDYIHIINVDASNSIGWKTGLFVFDHENIKDIMRKIARWYDVDIYYEGNITKEGFTGSVSRHQDISEVLNTLELTGLVKFKVKDRAIIVLSK